MRKKTGCPPQFRSNCLKIIELKQFKDHKLVGLHPDSWLGIPYAAYASKFWNTLVGKVSFQSHPRLDINLWKSQFEPNKIYRLVS